MKHDDLVMCKFCGEWTTFGESCCGETACDDECPICSLKEKINKESEE